MVRPAVFLVSALLLSAQPPSNQDPTRLLRDVQNAIGNRDLVDAYDAVSKLDDAIQTRIRTLMVRDARQRVDEVLTWLPATTESLIVSQEPFVIGNSSQRLDAMYLMGQLALLNGGTVLSALRGHTV